MMIDPRLSGAKKMLSKIKTIIPVMSSKGGVGKTIVSTILALQLSREGFKTGLLDLDVNDPNTHIVLGLNLEETLPEEEEGVKPVTIHDIHYMTIAFYTKNKVTPLRGEEIDNAIKEILAITNWGELDYLVVDTPPGLGDEVLDVIHYLPNPKPLIVTTTDKLSTISVRRLIGLLQNEGIKDYWIVYNMVKNKDDIIKENQHVLGIIPFDEKLERNIGNPKELLKLEISKAIHRIILGIKQVS